MNDLGKLKAAIALVITIVTAAFGVDAFYMREADAKDQHQQAKEAQQTEYLEIQLKIAKLELKQAKAEGDETGERLAEKKVTLIENKLLEQ